MLKIKTNLHGRIHSCTLRCLLPRKISRLAVERHVGPHLLNFVDFSVPPAHEAEGFAMATINQAPPCISHLESTLILHSLPHTYVSLGPFLTMFPCFLVFPDRKFSFHSSSSMFQIAPMAMPDAYKSGMHQRVHVDVPLGKDRPCGKWGGQTGWWGLPLQ